MMAKVDFELISKDYKDAGRQKPKPSSRTQELTQYRYHKSTTPREIIRGFYPVQLELQKELHGEIQHITILQGTENIIVRIHFRDRSVQEL